MHNYNPPALNLNVKNTGIKQAKHQDIYIKIPNFSQVHSTYGVIDSYSFFLHIVN